MRRLTCKETSLLVSQSLDRKLPWGERVAVRLHLFVCEACKRFKAQTEFLRRAVRRGAEQLEEASALKLSSPARQRIARAMRRKPK
jgi:hypothetical protein